jgi:hypothetical protein
VCALQFGGSKASSSQDPSSGSSNGSQSGSQSGSRDRARTAFQAAAPTLSWRLQLQQPELRLLVEASQLVASLVFILL